MKKILYLLMGVILFGGLYSSCVSEELPGSIYGTVVDKATGEPIKSAGVELSPSGLKTVTGSEGQFEFTELDPGKYTLLITKTGYVDGSSHTIEVKPGKQAKGDVQIEKLPPSLRVVDDKKNDIDTLDFGDAEDDVARSFSLFNDGVETLEWQLTITADWIKSISKSEGVLATGCTESLLILIDREKLKSGENTTTIHITSNNGNKQVVVVATNNYHITILNVLPVTEIEGTSVTLNAEIITEGNPKYTERGFVYSEIAQLTIENAIKIAVPFTNDKIFSALVTDLTPSTKYYVRAYAIHEGKCVYSINTVAFVTKELVLPTVSTTSATKISNTSAVVGGNVIYEGGISVIDRGVVYSTSQNPTIEDNKISSGYGKGEFLCNLINLQKGIKYYVRAYAINTIGVSYGNQVEFIALTPPFENGHEYIDLGLSVKWATCNIGASTPENYGDYYAWGETYTKNNYSWITYKWYNGSESNFAKYCGTVDNKIILDLCDDVANVNWGGSWRIPTKFEYEELINECKWEWTTQGGVYGRKATSKVNGQTIFFPAGGGADGTIYADTGKNGYYWTSSRHESKSASAYYFFISNYSKTCDFFYVRRLGLLVRPVCP